MKSDEARTAEAITALTTRLESWGVSDASDKATEYVRDMVRAGWRPRAREVWTPPGINGGALASPETAAQAAASARAAMRAAKDITTKRQATTGSLREREEAS